MWFDKSPELYPCRYKRHASGNPLEQFHGKYKPMPGLEPFDVFPADDPTPEELSVW